MKTDTIFYRLFQSFPSIFFELINRAPEAATNYEFTSREVKQLSFRLDGLFLPKTNQPNQPLYLVEVQFQPDPSLYYRIFAELFLYLKQYQPPHPWQIVVIYPSRSIEREQTLHFGNLLNLNQVRRIYLDELREGESSLGVEVVKLVIEPEETAGERARRLIAQARQQLTDEAIQRDLIDLIETIIVYKLPKKSREEIATMLGLTSELKKTRFYQEVLEEGKEEGKQENKLETIPRLLPLGLSLEQIAQALDLPLEVVQQTAQSTRSKITSVDEQNIAVFNRLLNSQPSLFSPEDRNELVELIAPLPDQSNLLYLTLSEWYEKHPEILKAQLTMLDELFGDSFSQEKVSGSTEGKVIPPINSANKQTLLNSIQQS
ncbi:Rpn family recombination-promoting nuclease/putative transposase [Limnofasciculus baicalensis]|uniref:Rpn family recombination-promoting nuclease/putative transposase n=1 Tax=Limnofasciculus baicalensis BBK-W-15 TaxID=2699891 RepID=A0AAE3KQR5_9CYAN|nr:Rpn family recombination-promoting nuclease/putative transposase [Limnofasciculus baicalensis]MCP2727652.1 Rpn family recombination-promoting nuclease/putative transposase [Limnofasciculus baicalensis BBK-W-15]